MKIRKSSLLNLIGGFLVILGLIRIFQILFSGVPVHIFWLCNHVLVIMGIAILFRNSFVLIGEFSFLFIGQFFWIIGFSLYFLFGVALPGSSAYLIYESQFVNLISTLVHFLTLPLGFIAILILSKKEKFAWVFGLVHALILVPIVIYFGSSYNLNCFFNPCFSVIPNFSLYSFLIIPIYFLLFVIPLNYFVNWIIRKNKNKFQKL